MQGYGQSNGDETQPLRYEAARQSLRDFVAQMQDRGSEEREALNALSGYREALAQANSSEEARLRLIELTPQVAEIQGKYSARDAKQTAARERLVTVLAGLDASDIRQFFRGIVMDEEFPLTFSLACRFLASSKNTQAVIPLIERLQNPVAARPEPHLNSRFARLIDTVVKHTVARNTYRNYDEMNRAFDRCFTLRLLDQLQDRRAEVAIRPFLHDPDAEVRKVAQEALWSLRE